MLKKLFPLVLLLLCLVGGASAWYNVSWPYMQRITLNTSMINGSNTNFPMLVYLPNDTNLSAHAQASGNDILFTNSSDSKLAHEIELYNSSNGSLVAWVNVQNVTNLTTITIFMYYGNATVGNQQNVTGTWNSNYVGVWHFPNGTNLTANDSTSYGNNGTIYGGPKPQPVVAGVADGAASVDGAQNFINITESTAFEFGTGSFSLSVWVLPGNAGGCIFCNTKSGLTAGWRLFESGNRLQNRITDGTNLVTGTNSGTLNDGKWHLLNMVVDKGAAKKMHSYVDGVEVGTGDSIAAVGSVTDAGAQLTFGAQPLNPGYTSLYKGSIDEAELFNIVLPQNWILTHYSNLNNPSLFFTSGTEETQGGSWYNTSWQYKKNLTINSSSVNGTSNANFPVLIYLQNDTNLSNEAQANGNDILFTDSSNVKLAHEIESFNSSNGTLVAWVNVPNVTNVTNTVIFMYYGNSTVSNQQNMTGAWNSNYVGVWHFPNGTTLSANDSTSYGNNGTLSAANTTPQPVVAGIADGGVIFDAQQNFINFSENTAFEFGTNSFSLSIWTNASSNASGCVICNTKTGAGAGWRSLIVLNKLENRLTDGTHSIISNDSGLINDSKWHLLNMVVDKGAAKKMHTYVDGVEVATGDSIATVGSVTDATAELDFGAQPSTPPGHIQFYNGIIDEAEFSNIALPQTWIQTHYSNLNNPSLFFTLGAEETQPCDLYPGSGDWTIDSIACPAITLQNNLLGNNFFCIGTGRIRVSGSITNFKKMNAGTCEFNAITGRIASN